MKMIINSSKSRDHKWERHEKYELDARRYILPEWIREEKWAKLVVILVSHEEGD